MKSFKQFLHEDIIDDILSDYEDAKAAKPRPEPKVKYHPEKRLPRKRIKVKFPPAGFKQYIRSLNELKDKLKDHEMDSSKITIEKIASLYAYHKVAVDDNFTIMIDTDDAAQYREYDRNVIDGFTGLRSEEEYEKTKQSIKEKGIQKPIRITMERTKNGDVVVFVGEGNHRIKIAKELGIDKIPVRINAI